MKELNMTEAQLRSWRPRRPAAGLKQRIFAVETAAPPATWLWGGLAPAMICLFLTWMAFNRDGDGFASKPVLAMVLSNQNDTACATDAGQASQNHLASITFDWTNISSFKSIVGFTPSTNFSN